MRKTENAVEKHPIFHDWYLVGDYVHERDNRNRPLVVKREEKCYHCPTQRHTRINVCNWTRIGARQYIYTPGVTIVRMTKQEFLKNEFLRTTDLPNDILDVIIPPNGQVPISDDGDPNDISVRVRIK